MDKLQYIVQQLDSEEFKSLDVFLQRNRFRKDRKDAELLQLFRDHEELSLQKALKKLYGGKDETIAYHALRKRLLSHILDFLSVQEIENKKGQNQYSSLGLLNLANFFFERGVFDEGFLYLKKAIIQEENDPSGEFLMKAYLLWIQNWRDISSDESYEEVLNNYQKAEADFLKWQHLKLVAASVKRNMYQSKMIGIDFDVYDLLKDIAKEFDLKKSYLNSVEGVWLVASSIEQDKLSDDELKKVYSWLYGRCKKKISAEETEPTSASRLLEIYLVLSEIALTVGKSKAIGFIRDQSEVLLDKVNKVEANQFKVYWKKLEWLYYLNFEDENLEGYTEKILKYIDEKEIEFTIPRSVFCFQKAGGIGVKAFLENGKHKMLWYLNRLGDDERAVLLFIYFIAYQELERNSILINRILKWVEKTIEDEKLIRALTRFFKLAKTSDQSEYKDLLKFMETNNLQIWKPIASVLFAEK